MLHYFPSIFPANYEIVISKHASRYQSDELLHCKLISNAFRVRGIAISGREIAHIDTEITRYKIRPSLPLPSFRNFREGEGEDCLFGEKTVNGRSKATRRNNTRVIVL